MSVDVEGLVATFLRGQAAVTDLAADRVYTDMPHKREWPLVLITRLGGRSLYRNWLEAIDIEISTYGGTHKAAYNLAQACITTMAAALVGTHTEGVVTKVSAEAVAYEPDPDSADQQGHSRPRYTVSATVTAHPQA